MDLSLLTAVGVILIIGTGFPVLLMVSAAAAIFLRPRRGRKH